VIKTELWDTITRRGFMGNVLMGVRRPYVPYASTLLTLTLTVHTHGILSDSQYHRIPGRAALASDGGHVEML
jgi:hypothetical protein